MMYEMLTGEQPYKGEQPMQIAYQHANESVPRPSALNPAVPDDFDDLVLWATERNPDDRPKDARELLERLREVERHLGYSTTTAAQSTMIMPAPAADSGQLTQVLTSNAVRTGPVDPADPSSQLSAKTTKRRTKGWLALIMVLILVGAAAGTGWWFGSGPGSQVEIPSVAGASEADATAALRALGLTVEPVQENSLTVAQGLAIGTDPAEHTHVDKNSSVRLLVSIGPRPVTVDPLAGMLLADAQTYLQSLNMTVGTVSQRFDEAAVDTVLSAAQQSDGADLSQGGASFEGVVVDLVTSAGPLPSVVGESVDNATNILKGVGLAVAGTTEDYHDEIAAGSVIAIAPKTDEAGATVPFVPGDAVTLVVSKGPEPIPVPDVTTQNVAAAKSQLEDLGFVVDVTTGLPEPFWGIGGFVVESTDPPAGTSIPRGSTVTIDANY